MDETATGRLAGGLAPWMRQGLWFVVVGVASTAANAAIYLLLRQWWGLVTANAVALALTTIVSSEANRMLTFTGHDTNRTGLNAQSLLVFLFYCFYNTLTLAALHLIVPGATPQIEAIALFLVSGLAGVGRFLLLRLWVFRALDQDGGS